jgi:hypothetical protein
LDIHGSEDIVLNVLLRRQHNTEGAEREYSGSDKKLRRPDAAMHNRSRIRFAIEAPANEAGCLSFAALLHAMAPRLLTYISEAEAWLKRFCRTYAAEKPVGFAPLRKKWPGSLSAIGRNTRSPDATASILHDWIAHGNDGILHIRRFD